MFSLQIFTELLIVGVFLLLGTLPLLLLMNEPGDTGSEFWPLTGDYSSKVKIVLALVLAYAAGAAGNRLVDDFWEDAVKLDSEHKYENNLRDDLAKLGALSGGAGRIICAGYVEKERDCIKVAHMSLRERSEATREWLDNRRAYIRLMRAAAVSGLLFIFSVMVYKLRRRDSKRFKLVHVILVAVFTSLLTYAHWNADKKYWKRVYELYMALPPTAAATAERRAP